LTGAAMTREQKQVDLAEQSEMFGLWELAAQHWQTAIELAERADRIRNYRACIEHCEFNANQSKRSK
jgi:hypothetical protein